MLQKKLLNYNLILASASPRRQQLLSELGLKFRVQIKPVTETYPNHLKHYQISNYLAQLKATPFKKILQEKDILLTSDTIVWLNNQAIGKPKNNADAFHILKTLSNQTHEVITSVCFTTNNEQITDYAVTKVTFAKLNDTEINFYLNKFKPYDKAGAYGIQDWIGYIGVTKIEGSYFNVMGLPVHLVYKNLVNLTC